MTASDDGCISARGSGGETSGIGRLDATSRCPRWDPPALAEGVEGLPCVSSLHPASDSNIPKSAKCQRSLIRLVPPHHHINGPPGERRSKSRWDRFVLARSKLKPHPRDHYTYTSAITMSNTKRAERGPEPGAARKDAGKKDMFCGPDRRTNVFAPHTRALSRPSCEGRQRTTISWWRTAAVSIGARIYAEHRPGTLHLYSFNYCCGSQPRILAAFSQSFYPRLRFITLIHSVLDSRIHVVVHSNNMAPIGPPFSFHGRAAYARSGR